MAWGILRFWRLCTGDYCYGRAAQGLLSQWKEACGKGKTRSRRSPQTENSQSVGSKGSCHSREEYWLGILTKSRTHHTPRKGCISYLWNFRPILLARAWSSNTVWPQAALISFHSTGTLGRRPSLKLLIVPNCPLCLLRKAEGQGKIQGKLKTYQVPRLPVIT